MNKKWWTAILAIAIVGALVRFYAIGSKSLWYDEFLSWRLASFPLPLMVQRTGEATTVHPPVYFGLLHAWMRVIGDSPIALRALSALCGVAGIIVLGLMVRAWSQLAEQSAGGPADRFRAGDAGLLAAALLALSPLHIVAAQQVRNYTLAALFLLLSTWILARALLRPGDWRWWAGYAGCCILGLYTHYLLLPFVGTQALVALAYWLLVIRRRPVNEDEPEAAPPALISTPILAYVIIGVAFVPWLTRFWYQSENARSCWSRPLGFSDLVSETCVALTGTWRTAGPALSWSACAPLAILVGLWLALLIRRRWDTVFVTLAGLLPLLAMIYYSLNSERSIIDARYLSFAQLFWLAAIAVTVSLIRQRPERVLVGLVIVVSAAATCYLEREQLGPHHNPGMAEMAKLVQEKRAADELVVASNPFAFLGASYYLRDVCPVYLAAPERDRFAFRAESQLLDSDLLTPADLAEKSPSAIWMVGSNSYISIAKNPFAAQFIVSSPAWETEDAWRFKQDIYWERPVLLTYLRSRPEALAHAGSTGGTTAATAAAAGTAPVKKNPPANGGAKSSEPQQTPAK